MDIAYPIVGPLASPIASSPVNPGQASLSGGNTYVDDGYVDNDYVD